MKKRLAFILIITIASLFFAPASHRFYNQPAEASIDNPIPAGNCDFRLFGDGRVAGASYLKPDKTLTLTALAGGAKPNQDVVVTVIKPSLGSQPFVPKNSTEPLTFTIHVDASGTGTGNLTLPDTGYDDKEGRDIYGAFEIQYDKYALFGNCETVNPDEKTFYVPSDGPGDDTYVLILPNDPPVNTNNPVSIYFIGVDKLHYTGNSKAPDQPFKHYMVKSYGDDNGPDKPGFSGSFMSQANGGDLWQMDDGEGDICDRNPHPAYHGDDMVNDHNKNCIEADHWSQNDFIDPVTVVSYDAKGIEHTDQILELRGFCENMHGVDSSCDNPFTLDDSYTFSIYGIADPPARGTETENNPAKPSEPNSDPCKDSTNDNINGLRVDTCDVYGPLMAPSSNGDVPVAITFTVGKAKSGSSFPGETHLTTPFGNITITPQGIATAFLNLGIGAGGGLAFLLMIFGAYRLIFAAGDPESIQKGRQVITSAIVGLLVIVFAIFLLRLFGIGVLGLPIGG